jgi:DNA-binding protein YbaB
VTIDRQTFADDPEMAEDLVAAAINDAVNKVAQASRDRMGNVTAGMSLPPGFKMPF